MRGIVTKHHPFSGRRRRAAEPPKRGAYFVRNSPDGRNAFIVWLDVLDVNSQRVPATSTETALFAAAVSAASQTERFRDVTATQSYNNGSGWMMNGDPALCAVFADQVRSLLDTRAGHLKLAARVQDQR